MAMSKYAPICEESISAPTSPFEDAILVIYGCEIVVKQGG